MNWTTAAPAVTTAFLGSLVEAVEALTIVVAVASVRGWRPAGIGAIAALVLLVFIVVALGPVLDRIPLHLLQLVIGVLLLLFGTRWLRKAILRAAGDIALHDEAIAFAVETAIQAFSMAIANKINATAMSTNRAKVCIYLPLGRQRMSFSPTAATRDRTPDGCFDAI